MVPNVMPQSDATVGRSATGRGAWPLLSLGLVLTLSSVLPAPAPSEKTFGSENVVASPLRVTVEIPDSSTGADPGGLNAVPYAESAWMLVDQLWRIEEYSPRRGGNTAEEWNTQIEAAPRGGSPMTPAGADQYLQQPEDAREGRFRWHDST